MKNLFAKIHRRLGSKTLPVSPQPRLPDNSVAKPTSAPPLPAMTLMTAGRLLYQKRLFDLVRHLDGDVVECGVGQGHTLLMWAALCHDEARPRRLWGFDSFEGFPEPSPEDASPRNPRKGEWNKSTMKGIHDLLVAAGLSAEWVRARVTLVKGFFEKSLPKHHGKQIALLHLDADLYQSYKTSLSLLYDKVQPGGVIAFDEYMGSFEHLHFPGAKQAIDEFFANQNVEMQRDLGFGKYYVIKPL